MEAIFVTSFPRHGETSCFAKDLLDNHSCQRVSLLNVKYKLLVAHYFSSGTQLSPRWTITTCTSYALLDGVCLEESLAEVK